MARKHLRTVKRASEITGLSIRYLRQLLSDGVLTTYKIRSSTMLSLTELEDKVAFSVPKQHAS